MSFYSDISELILSKKIHSKEELHKAKVQLCKKYKKKSIPADSVILAHLSTEYSNEERAAAVAVLRKKPMRTISGVAVVAVMTSPDSCPHGTCIPCPGGPGSNTPQSYTGYEPAAMRAVLNEFDPFLQVKSRLEQLSAIGHAVDKIDLIVMGGTFTARPHGYQQWFVKRCFDALNHRESSSLDDAKQRNEHAVSRCIGLTVETRPDWFYMQHADHALYLGATRVELGIQTVYDDVLYGMNRGHTVMDAIAATRIAKDCGFKVCYHMMPGLPGSDETRDIEAFRTIFEDPLFKPDMIKIYPVLTIQGTRLYDLWHAGAYEPLTTESASKLIAKVKHFVPEWVRIQRIQRDIPASCITAGVGKSNLRQLVEREMNEHGGRCRCIRCREIGHRSLKEEIVVSDDDIGIDCTYYEASGGEEVFLSLVDKQSDTLIGYLRMREVGMPHRYELTKGSCMVIRELKVLGRELPLGLRTNQGWQHRGYGRELLDEAARISKEEYGMQQLVVLSGVGVKEYYREFGFNDDGMYLSKLLQQ